MTTLLHIFPCLICNIERKIKLIKHLRSNDACALGYTEIFGCQDLEDIISQVTKLKKRSYQSRQPKERSAKYQSLKENGKSIEGLLNLYRVNICFSNIYKCIICKLNLNETQTRKLNRDERRKYVLNPIDSRLGGFYICFHCEKGQGQDTEDNDLPFNLVAEMKEDENFVYYSIHYPREENDPEEEGLRPAILEGQLDSSQIHIEPSLALDELINNIPSQSQNNQIEPSNFEVDEAEGNSLLEVQHGSSGNSEAVVNCSLALDELINNILSQSQNNQIRETNFPNFEIDEGVNCSLALGELINNIPSRSQNNQSEQSDFQFDEADGNSMLEVQHVSFENSISNDVMHSTLQGTISEVFDHDDSNDYIPMLSQNNQDLFTNQSFSPIYANSFQDNLNDESFIDNDRIIHQDQRKRFILVEIPSTYMVKSLYPTNYMAKKCKARKLICHGDVFSEDKILGIYSTYLAKYLAVKIFHRGVIKNNLNRTILARCYRSDKFIAGSNEYRERHSNEMKFKFDHNGILGLYIKVSYPMDNLETIASYLVQKNYVVTQDLNGSEENDFKRRYLVHNHKSDVFCNANCVTITLDEFITTRFDMNTIGDDIIPAYVFSCFQKIREFISRIVKGPTDLEAEEHSFRPLFMKNGEIYVEGIIWPKSFNKFNKMLSDFSYGSPWNEDVVIELLMKLEKEITTRTDINYHRDVCLTSLSANLLSEMSVSKQLHLHPCSRCQNIQLPSPSTILVRPLVTLGNVYPSDRLRKILIKILSDLELYKKENLSLEEWLNDLSENEVQVCFDTRDSIKVTIEAETLTFVLDDDMSSVLNEHYGKPFLGIYQYILMFGETYKIHIKKKYLREVFTHPYSILFLRAADSTVDVLPTFKGQHWSQIQDPVDIVCQDHHRIMSLAEALTTLDGRMFNISDSQGTIYMDPNPGDSFPIRVVTEETDMSLTTDPPDRMYEEIVTLKKMFFKRINASFITLIEFMSWYEEVKNNAIEIFSAYKDNLGRPLKTLDK